MMTLSKSLLPVYDNGILVEGLYYDVAHDQIIRLEDDTFYIYRGEKIHFFLDNRRLARTPDALKKSTAIAFIQANPDLIPDYEPVEAEKKPSYQYEEWSSEEWEEAIKELRDNAMAAHSDAANEDYNAVHQAYYRDQDLKKAQRLAVQAIKKYGN